MGQLVRISDERIIDSAMIAVIHMGLGNIEGAFKWLEKAYEEHSPSFAYLKVAQFWKLLLVDPRCQSILRRLNFPE